MDISYKWIQEEYFDTALPKPEELVERITKGAFEIESIEKRGDDYVIDVDVLPNRAHDCLCHRGIAKEIGVLLEKSVKEKVYEDIEGESSVNDKLEVIVEEPELCPRYIGRYIQGIKVGPSPKWLKERVESIGQRSINNIVDITNYILFDLGQPLHVFDADKIEGGKIVVRKAKNGEKITTLDGKEVELDDTMLVIADAKEPLALAGVKGGLKAEVDEHTTNVVIEAANFNSVSVRKTAQKTAVKTDASKRYENGISSEIAGWGMKAATELMREAAGTNSTVIGKVKDVYSKKEEIVDVIVSLEKVNRVLGVEITEEELESIFERFGFEYIEKDDMYSIPIPFERLDLRIPEDIIEEVGRVYGYDNVPEVLPEGMDFKAQVHKMFYYQNKIRTFLVARGYADVQTYVFRPEGDIKLANPLAQDRPYVRANLTDGLMDALIMNARNVDLLGIDTVNIFENGAVFTKDREYVALGIGYHDPKKKKGKAKEKETLEAILKELSDELGATVQGDIVDRPEGGAVVQIDMTKLVDELPQPETFGDVLKTQPLSERFKSISQYPFMTRDIAVFVNNEEDKKVLEKILVDRAGELLIREPRLFDVFKKQNDDGTSRVSYAYKLVFQSYEKTLTDEEVNKIMDGMYTEITTHEGWEVR